MNLDYWMNEDKEVGGVILYSLMGLKNSNANLFIFLFERNHIFQLYTKRG